MKLTELDAVFVKYIPRPPTDEERALNPHWPADYVVDSFRTKGVTINEADGILFVCPKSRAEDKDHYIQVYFVGSAVPDRIGKNKDGKTVRWSKQGTGMDDLSLQPSIEEQSTSCGWHGFVTLGDAK